jgi:excisionase family DNA binding protein
MAEFMSFDEVVDELGLDDDEVKQLISQGELRSIKDGSKIKFRTDDVLALKESHEAEPTIILTDSDQEMGIAESSDELILDESTSDTVLNIGDIMSPERQEEEIVFSDSTEEFLISPHDSDPEAAIPTVEIPSVDEDLGLYETDSDAALVASASAPELSAAATTEARPLTVDSGEETFELLEDEEPAFEELDELDEEDEPMPRKTQSGRISRSARLRAMQMKQRPSELIWTVIGLVAAVILILPGAVVLNRMAGTNPEWVYGFAEGVRGSIGALIEAML